MSDEAAAQSQRRAAQYLRELLLRPGPYREVWQRRVERPREGVINQLAVAEVLAGHLQAAPLRTGDARVMPYQLRDTISGVISGGHLSRHTLQLFIDAFGIAEPDAHRLWRLWNGSMAIGVVVGTHAVPPQWESDLVRTVGPSLTKSVSLHDHVYVGPDAKLNRVRMIQVLEATAQDVDRVPLLCDTNILSVEVGKGAKELSGEMRQIGDDLFVADILLARTLSLGETITVEYWLTYRFPGHQAQVEREFRRGVIRQIENLDMRVEFHPDCIPANVWWARWDGAEGGVLEQEVVTLDSQYSAHRYMRSLEKTVVGFYWEW